jgi:catechol 2,3-dioxygenase-like lactoylglutathione lyase family enzyme
VFERVGVRASDPEASERFYATVLGTLEMQRSEFQLLTADGEHPPTRGLHIGFVAPSRAHVQEFWRAGVDAGYRDDGEPGPRPEYGADYYGGFLLDPDGNSAEAVHHDSLREGGIVDHLWIRVADVAASKRFYESLGPHAGFRLGKDLPERAQFIGGGGSFSVLTGDHLTENLELAFRLVDGAGRGPGEQLDPDGNRVELVGR